MSSVTDELNFKFWFILIFKNLSSHMRTHTEPRKLSSIIAGQCLSLISDIPFCYYPTYLNLQLENGTTITVSTKVKITSRESFDSHPQRMLSREVVRKIEPGN